MVKIVIKYENEIEKIKIIEALAKGVKLGDIHTPCKKGKYYRCYVDVVA